MKTVYSDYREIMHLWANGSLPEHRIRTSTGNVSAEGNLLFSYRECIGILTPAHGVILSKYRWSNTTSKHQYAARHATSHLKCTYVDCHFPENGDIQRLTQLTRKRAFNLLEGTKTDTARTFNNHLASVAHTCQSLINFAHTVDDLGTAPVVATLQDFKDWQAGIFVQAGKERAHVTIGQIAGYIDYCLNNEAFSSYEARRLTSIASDFVGFAELFKVAGIKTYEKRSAKLWQTRLNECVAIITETLDKVAKALVIENREHCELWRATGECNHVLNRLPVMLRITDDTIQTSHGASVPLAVAPILWQMVQLSKANRTAVNHSLTVGDYTLNRINADGSIKVGCHDIAYSELERMAQELKYI